MRKFRQYLVDLFFTAEFLRYFVSGVVATLVNLLVYMSMSRWLGLDRWYYSDVPAIFLSVVAAYVLNRLWVFHSREGLIKEFMRFAASRLAISFFFEYAGIYFIRHVLQNTTEIIPGTLDLGKLIALIFVVLANRISGKFYVFKSQAKEESAQAHLPVDPQVYLDRAMETIKEAKVFANHDSQDRAARLYRQLGDPWRDYPAFHIAGTNGKGSISSYLTHILCHAGHKVGWYTSPYLEQFNERIRVLDGPEGLAAFDHDFTAGAIPDEAIARLMARIEKAAERLVKDKGPAPTQFDLMTAMAFLWFQEKACDVVVLETGMGGRLDSTNVLEKPLASLIGAPGFDHMDRLGDSMNQIMGEKAGIVKAGCPVFAYAPQDALLAAPDAQEARQVLEDKCRELNSPLTFFGYDDFDLETYAWSGQTFKDREGKAYSTKLLGLYQPVYALMAQAATLETGMADEGAASRGIADCIWPARMEVLSEDPLILLDGAHNVQACLGLRQALTRLSGDKPVYFVIGLLQDKEHREMLEALLYDTPYQLAGLVGTQPSDPRTFPSADLLAEAADILGADSQIRLIDRPDPGVAMLEAIARAEESGAMICVCGSLYLAGEVRPFIRQWLKKGKSF